MAHALVECEFHLIIPTNYRKPGLPSCPLIYYNFSMLKYNFYNDYSEGAHPRLLEILKETNLDQETGYGEDSLCMRAAGLIRADIHHQQAAVHFISGGTQANMIAISSALKPYESVIAASSAHIHVHETGAVEATGHKINIVPSSDGKLTPDKVEAVCAMHTDEHMVRPRLVFISNATEVGTVYRKAELKALSQVCHERGLYLYMDGARLGSALVSEVNNASLPDLAEMLDMFYIGGTKNGALIGEALVIMNPVLQKEFRFHIKQKGALLAKGRVMGSQFLGLFQDGLFFELARHANRMAQKMIEAFQELGLPFFAEPETNQVFPILPNTTVKALQADYGFNIWAEVDGGHSAIRLVTSWATPEEKVDSFINDLRAVSKP